MYFLRDKLNMDQKMQSGCDNRHKRMWKAWTVFLCLISVLVFCISLSRAEQSSKQPVLRNMVRRLKNMPAEDARKMLQQLKIGRDINLLPHNALIVTSENSADLLKASSLLKIADSGQSYTVATILSSPNPKRRPDNDNIEKMLGNVAVGTFLEPPSKTEKPKVILDMHNFDLVAVAPKEMIIPIRAAVKRLQDIQFPAPKAEPAPQSVVAPKGQPEAVPEPVKPESKPQPQVKEEPAKDELLEALKELGAVQQSEVIEQKVPEAVPVEVAPEPVVEEEADFFSDELFRSLAEAEEEALEPIITPPAPKPEVKPEPVIAAPEPAIEETPSPKAEPEIKPEPVAEPVATPKLEVVPEPEPKPEVKSEPVKPEPTPQPETKPEAAPEPAIPTPKPQPEPEEDSAQDELLRALQLLAAKEKPAKPAEKTPPAADIAEEEAAIPSEPEPVTERPKKKPPREPKKKRPVEPKAKSLEAKEELESEIDFTPAAEKQIDQYIPVLDGKTDHVELPGSEEELELTISLPEKVAILELIELVGKQLRLNYVYDPSKIQNKTITLRIHDGKIKVRDMYSLLENVLKSKGFVMVRHGNLVNIVLATEAAKYDPAIRDVTKPIRPGDTMVTTVIRLKYTDTTTVQNMLQAMQLGTDFQSIPETKTLMITGYAYRMKRIEELIKMIDVDIVGEPRIFKTRQIEYLIASDMAAKVDTLAKQIGTFSVTVSVSSSVSASGPTPPRGGRQTAAQKRAAAAKKAAAKSKSPKSAPVADGVYLDTDDRTNRIIMIGIRKDIEIANKLIDTLDVPQHGLQYIKEYAMQHVEPAVVIDTLNLLGVATSTKVSGGNSKAPKTRTTPSTASGGTGQPQIAILEGSNIILVNATAEQHASIVMIVGYVDVERQDFRTTQQYEIQYVGADEVLDVLAEMDIIGASKRSSSRGSTSQRNQRSTASKSKSKASTGTVSSSQTKPEDEPLISILPATNSLLVNATPDQHKQIATIIAFVDAELDETVNPYIVYPLENQDPVELADTLISLIEKTITTSKKGKDGKVETRTIPQTGANNEDITIIADAPTNSLIVAANKKNQNLIAALIAKLDVYRPQVLLDVTLVEITKDDQFTFDLRTVGRRGGFDRGGEFDYIESPFSPPLDTDKWGKSILEGAFDGTSFTGFYSDSNIQALLETVDDKGYGRVLARPSILVRDNQEGSINTTGTIYIAEEKSNIVNTDSGTTTSSDVNFKPYKSGINLTITPQVASPDLMQLHIELKRTDFQGEIGETVNVGGEDIPKPLDTIESEVITDATIPNGATIILGGIETINQNKSVSKVPILGDIPLIGLLFRGIGESDKQSRLYVFVKAHIIKPSDALTGYSDIEKISRKKRRAYEEAEARFQGLESIPGIKPNPIPPETILEDDEYLQELIDRAYEADKVEVNIELN